MILRDSLYKRASQETPEHMAFVVVSRDTTNGVIASWRQSALRWKQFIACVYVIVCTCEYLPIPLALLRQQLIFPCLMGATGGAGRLLTESEQYTGNLQPIQR